MQDAFGGEAALHRPGTNVEQEPGLAALSRWYGAAAEVLEAVRAKHGDLKPGPGPVRCWPHHFDIAVLVRLEEGAAESVRSIGVGCAPGDENYPEPYFYVIRTRPRRTPRSPRSRRVGAGIRRISLLGWRPHRNSWPSRILARR